MTIGKNSRKASVRSSVRAPKFLDKSSGFYGRLDEPLEDVGGMEAEHGGSTSSVATAALDGPGAAEDDGETLLQRKPGRQSGRWRRRSSRRKLQEVKAEGDAAQEERPGPDGESRGDLDGAAMEAEMEKLRKLREEDERAGKGREAPLAHFTDREDADDQVLIGDKKRELAEEGAEERSLRREQEKGMKVVKRSMLKNYRKAFRRGWEAFLTNIYSVTLTPGSPSSSSSSSPPPSTETKSLHKAVLAEFR